MIGDYMDFARRHLMEAGFDGVPIVLRPFTNRLHQLRSPLVSDGENIYDFDWDVMVLLDGCRVDTFKKVAHRTGLFSSEKIRSRRSVGSMTAEWMESTFIDKYHSAMSETVYVCGNPYSRHKLNESDFDVLDEVWEYGWDDELGTIPPRPITDRAIHHHRRHSPGKLIVHYMQPHCPFIGDTSVSRGKSKEEFGGESMELDVWERLHRRELSKSVVKSAYEQNLKYVFDDVEVLMENLEAEKVIISSDHGNAFGEWGVYGHPRGVAIDVVRNVPWLKTTASDKKTYAPTIETDEKVQIDVKDQLRALGYR